jgi:tRNA dimethylallyltransferase
MMQQGFVDEVKAVMQATQQQLDLPSMRCVGYRQVALFLQGEINASEMELQALSATRSLAKRQLTWMKKMQAQLRLQADVSTQKQLEQVLTYLHLDHNKMP